MNALVTISALVSAIAEVESVRELKRFHDQLEALQQLARRERLCVEDQNRIALLRIKVAQKAGRILAATVRRGGNSRGGSSHPLPGGISWNQSARWQKLARVEDVVAERYVAEATSRDEEATVAGLVRAARGQAVHFSSASEEWTTPPGVIEAVVELLGEIDLDPASDAARSIPAKHHFTVENNGLAKPWSGRVFLNPPYGHVLPDWVEAFAARHERAEFTEGLLLVPSRTDTEWFHRLRNYPRCFITGRLRFGGHHNTAPFPSMAVYAGPRVAHFYRAFRKLGDIYARVGGALAPLRRPTPWPRPETAGQENAG